MYPDVNLKKEVIKFSSFDRFQKLRWFFVHCLDKQGTRPSWLYQDKWVSNFNWTKLITFSLFDGFQSGMFIYFSLLFECISVKNKNKMSCNKL